MRVFIHIQIQFNSCITGFKFKSKLHQSDNCSKRTICEFKYQQQYKTYAVRKLKIAIRLRIAETHEHFFILIRI